MTGSLKEGLSPKPFPAQHSESSQPHPQGMLCSHSSPGPTPAMASAEETRVNFMDAAKECSCEPQTPQLPALTQPCKPRRVLNITQSESYGSSHGWRQASTAAQPGNHGLLAPFLAPVAPIPVLWVGRALWTFQKHPKASVPIISCYFSRHSRKAHFKLRVYT